MLEELAAWWAAGRPVGVATVVAARGSSPRPVGATMLVGPDDTAVGSVSAGCVEADVYELARAVRDGAEPALRSYGDTDDPLAAGLTCGGTVDVFVRRVDAASWPQLPEVAGAVRAGTPVAVATGVRDGYAGRHLAVWADRTAGSLGDPAADAAVAGPVRAMLADGRTGLLDDAAYPGAVFVASFPPPARMLLFGAADVAAPLSRLGALLGYDVTVCDARPVFTTARRFPAAHRVVVDWPHRYLRAEASAGRVDGRSVVCVLTHEERFDVPVLVQALRLPLAYVGALGSRGTHAERVRRLRAAGVTPQQLARLSAPVGLDLGGCTAEETALSIAAEVVAARCGGTGVPLRAATGRIHRVPVG